MLLDPPFGRAIKEWQRTTPSGLTAVFFALVAVGVMLVALRRKRLSVFDVLVLMLTLATAFEALRGIVWFGLACAALLPGLATREPGAAGLEARFGGAVVSLAVLVSIGLIAWTAARPASSFASRFPPALLHSVSAEAAHSRGRVLADDASADWLLWKLSSLRGRVAYDVRFELLTSRQINRLVAWSRLDPGWQAATNGYSLVVANPKHVGALVATRHWRRVFSSATTDVAVRVAVPKAGG
jgi:hypothetical protein